MKCKVSSFSELQNKILYNVSHLRMSVLLLFANVWFSIKVNLIFYMWILIHIASENFCAMSKSMYNMGNCISHMLTFIDVMRKFMCDMRFLICCMFSFICNVSWSIYDISILSCSMSETIHIVSINPFGCFNSFITWAEIALSVSIFGFILYCFRCIFVFVFLFL